MQTDWPFVPLSSFLVDFLYGKIGNYQSVDSLPTNLRSCLFVCCRVKFFSHDPGPFCFLRNLYVNVKGRLRTVDSYAASQKVPRFSGTPVSISSLQETCLEPCPQDIFSLYISSCHLSLHPRRRFAVKKLVRRHAKYFFSSPSQVSQDSPCCVTQTQW